MFNKKPKVSNVFIRLFISICLVFSQISFALADSVTNEDQTATLYDKVEVKGIAGQDYVKGEIIVKFKDSSINKGYFHTLANAQVLKTSTDKKTQLVKVNSTTSLVDTIRFYQNNPTVEYAEPNYRAKAAFMPNDSMISSQWAVPKMQLPQAWDFNEASSDIKIAILDTGVDLDHPDLANSLIAGKDFSDYDNQPDDENGHGTHVAGIAAAISNNGKGIAGVAGGAKIMPVRVLDWMGYGGSYDIISGIMWAADNGANIINLSLGMDEYSKSIEDAINYAYSKGVVIVAATGNDSKGVSYPAALNHVIGVAATDENDNVADFSNFGPEVDVAAPGVNILSTTPNTKVDPDLALNYDLMTGTSMASPQVAGLVALILSQNPSLTPDEVETILKERSDDLGSPGFDNYYGYGRINALKALTSEDKYENNDTLETAKVGELDKAIYGVLSSSGDADWFKYSINGPLTKISLKVPKGIDGKIDVYDKAGKVIKSINNGTVGITETEIINLPSGEYYFKISDNNGNSSLGSYTLKVNDGDIYEPNNKFEDATLINQNEEVYGKINPAGDSDYYKIEIPQSGITRITLKSPSTMDGLIMLYGGSKNLINSVDLVGKGQDEMIVKQLLPGTYYLKISDFAELSNSDTYKLSVNFATSDTVAPVITKTTPTNNQASVSVGKNIHILFDENIVEGNNYSNITLKDSKNNIVPIAKSISSNRLILDPLSDLSSNIKYTVSVPAGAVKDNVGNNTAQDNVFSFTTGFKSESTIFKMPFQVTDAKIDPDKPIVYITSDVDKKLYAVNYETGNISTINFDYTPERLEFGKGQYSDELYVTLLHQPHSSYYWKENQTGTIAVINRKDFTVKDSIEIGVDPFDIVADTNGILYIPSGSGQSTNFDSYDRSSKQLIDRTRIDQKCYALLNEYFDRIYTVTTDLSPRDYTAYNVKNGSFIDPKYPGGYDSPYHGDYPLATNFVISPNGKYLFNGKGNIFTTSRAKDQDMKYFTKINAEFSDIAFEADSSLFYTLPTNIKAIYVYDGVDFTALETMPLTGKGKFIFKKDGKFITVIQPDTQTEDFKMGIEVINSSSNDSKPPIVTSVKAPLYSTSVSGLTKFKVSWLAEDSASPSSGVASYDVEYREGGTSEWENWKTNFEGTEADFEGKAGKTYYFRVKANDKAGNSSEWAANNYMTIVPYDNNSLISSRKGFGNEYRSDNNNYLGTLRYSNKANEQITYKFTGSSVGLIVYKGPGRSKAKIYINNVYKSTIDTYSKNSSYRQIAYSTSWNKSGTHTIKIVNLATKGRNRIDIDGLAVKN